MKRNEYLIANARSKAGAQQHLVENWVAAYFYACDDLFDGTETQKQAEALLQFVSRLDKPATRVTLMSYANKLLNVEAQTKGEQMRNKTVDNQTVYRS